LRDRRTKEMTKMKPEEVIQAVADWKIRRLAD
jgi:hypothetical protein